jgi:hypothetical protein
MKTLMSPWRLVGQIAAISCLLALSESASATLLTFDALGDCCLFPDPPTYSENGYTFTLSGAEAPSGWHLGDGTSIPGTLNWHGTPGGFNSLLTLTLTKDGGGLFDLLGLDIDVNDGSILGVSAPQFAEQSFDANLRDEPLDFFGVSQVVFRHLRGTGVGIDNVLLRSTQAVAEPGALWLVIVGGFVAALARGCARGRDPARCVAADSQP